MGFITKSPVDSSRGAATTVAQSFLCGDILFSSDACFPGVTKSNIKTLPRVPSIGSYWCFDVFAGVSVVNNREPIIHVIPCIIAYDGHDNISFEICSREARMYQYATFIDTYNTYSHTQLSCESFYRMSLKSPCDEYTRVVREYFHSVVKDKSDVRFIENAKSSRLSEFQSRRSTRDKKEIIRLDPVAISRPRNQNQSSSNDVDAEHNSSK